jgi:hypothetical protein
LRISKEREELPIHLHVVDDEVEEQACEKDEQVIHGDLLRGIPS